MINLIKEFNKQSQYEIKKRALQQELEKLIDPQLKDLCTCRNAAVWTEIFNRMYEIKMPISDTVVEGIIRRAVEKYSKEPDTLENLTVAINAAKHYNLIRVNYAQEFVNFANEVERILTDAFTSVPEPEIRWRSSREI